MPHIKLKEWLDKAIEKQGATQEDAALDIQVTLEPTSRLARLFWFWLKFKTVIQLAVGREENKKFVYTATWRADIPPETEV